MLEASALVALIGMAIALRAAHALRGGLWRDEAQFLNIATLPAVGDVVRFLGAHESHPPLYYLLMRAWTAVAGTSDAAVVLPGLILGAVTIVAAWRLGRAIGTPATGWVAAGLVAMSPGLIEADSAVRPYTFLALLLLLAVSLLWLSLETGRTRFLLAWVITVTTILYTHNWGVLPVASMGILAIGVIIRRRSALSLRPFLLACVSVMMLWSPWLPSVVRQAQVGGQLSVPTSPLVQAAASPAVIRPGLFPDCGDGSWRSVSSGVLFLRRANPPASVPATGWIRLSTWVIFGAMTLATAGSFRTGLLVRHTIVMLAPLALIASAAVLTQRTAGRGLAAVTLIIVLWLNTREAIHLAGVPRSNTDVIARLATSEAGPDDLVLLVPGDLVSSFERYYSGRARTFPYPEGSDERPVEFDNRIAQETRPDVIGSAANRIAEVLLAGGKVWEVSAGMPEHLAGPWGAMIARMRSLGADPVDVTVSRPGGPASREDAGLRVWAIPASTRAR